MKHSQARCDNIFYCCIIIIIYHLLLSARTSAVMSETGIVFMLSVCVLVSACLSVCLSVCAINWKLLIRIYCCYCCNYRRTCVMYGEHRVTRFWWISSLTFDLESSSRPTMSPDTRPIMSARRCLQQRRSSFWRYFARRHYQPTNRAVSFIIIL